MKELLFYFYFKFYGQMQFKLYIMMGHSTLKMNNIDNQLNYSYTPKQGVCTVCFFKKLSFDELYFWYERVPKSPHFLCSLKKKQGRYLGQYAGNSHA